MASEEDPDPLLSTPVPQGPKSPSAEAACTLSPVLCCQQKATLLTHTPRPGAGTVCSPVPSPSSPPPKSLSFCLLLTHNHHADSGFPIGHLDSCNGLQKGYRNGVCITHAVTLHPELPAVNCLSHMLYPSTYLPTCLLPVSPSLCLPIICPSC